MNIARNLIMAVFGGLISYIVATTLLDSLVTGTTTADTLNKMGASWSNPCRITGLIRRTLSWIIQYGNAELNQIGNTICKCVEKYTLRILRDGDIFHALLKNWELVHYQPCSDYPGCCSSHLDNYRWIQTGRLT